MLAVGCLFPLLFLFAGAIGGSALWGASGLYWGGGIGLVLGCAVPAIMVYALIAARKRT